MMKFFKSKKVKVIAMLLVVAIMGGVIYNTGVTEKCKADGVQVKEQEKFTYDEALEKCVKYNEINKCYEITNQELIDIEDEKKIKELVDYVNTEKNPEEIQAIVEKQVITRAGKAEIMWYGIKHKMSYWDAYGFYYTYKELKDITVNTIDVLLPFAGLAGIWGGAVIGAYVTSMKINREYVLKQYKKCVDKKKGCTEKNYWTGHIEITVDK